MRVANGSSTHSETFTYSGDVTQSRGYRLVSLKSNDLHLHGELKLIGKPNNAFGRDIEDLVLEVEYKRGHELRVHIRDAANDQYQVPEDLRFGEPVHGENVQMPSDLVFNHQEDPFAFWITRPTGETIFDTRPDQIPVHEKPLRTDDFPVRDSTLPAYPLIFSDQYLQIASSLPEETNVYGLGDVVAESGFRRDNHHTIQTFWNGDPAGNPTDRNLYGSHPFYIEARQPTPGHQRLCHGVYLRNSHGMDVILRTGVVEYRCLGGTLDFTFMGGPDPHQVVQQYSQVIGRPAQMPYWSFGLHLCSISHTTLEETGTAVRKMSEADIPLECMWNDFWYMDRKRDFSVSKDFPSDEFKRFIDNLHQRGQRYIPLLDAGVYKPSDKTEQYDPYESGHRSGVFMKADNGSEYEGYVWCGKTVWPDWTHPCTDDWWRDCLATFKKTVDFDGIWLDMNEPANLPVATDKWLSTKSVVNIGGRVLVDLGQNLWDYPPYAIHSGWKALGDLTMSPSATTEDGRRHYHQHNLYPIQSARATVNASLDLIPDKRPFVLSRGTFAGQGHISAHWLGDNESTWDDLRRSIQGVLQHQLFQMPMVGADVGGFGGSTTEELLNRWMQLGAFLPFFRNHNAGTPQEPYLWNSVAAASRQAIDIRYRLLPYWESQFAHAHLTGSTPIRPLFFDFDDPALYAVDLQFMLGPALLVTPCLHQGATTVKGHFPTSNGTMWRDWYTHKPLANLVDGQADIPSPLGHIPLHIRSGGILLLHVESKYTLAETRKEPLELVVSLDDSAEANGVFYLDDGLSLETTRTKLAMTFAFGSLRLISQGSYQILPTLKRIRVLGMREEPSKCLMNGDPVPFEYDSEIEALTLEALDVSFNRDSELEIQ